MLARVNLLFVGLIALALFGSASAVFYKVTGTYLDSKCEDYMTYTATVVDSCSEVIESVCSGMFVYSKTYCAQEFPTGKFGYATETFNTTGCTAGSLESRTFIVQGCFNTLGISSRTSCSGDKFKSELCNSGNCGGTCNVQAEVTISDSCSATKTKTRCTSSASQLSGASIMFIMVLSSIFAVFF